MDAEVLAPDNGALIVLTLTLTSLHTAASLTYYSKKEFPSFHVIYSLPIPISYGLAATKLYP